MKINFWQVLGVILIIAGVIFFARSKTGKNDTTQPNNSTPTNTTPTAPATTQSA
jgi:hypothetical protein